MSYLYERVAYLRGLAEGMDISNESKEGKLLLNMLEVLEDFADSMSELNEDVADLEDYVETMDEDLAVVEDELFGEIDDEDFEDDMDFVEVKCPSCGEMIYLDEDFVDGEDEETELVCPSCHETIYIEEDCCDHEHGCCGHDHHDE